MPNSYEERMRKHGYTDEMLRAEKMMFEAARKRLKVKLVCTNGTTCIGNAFGYTRADDEESGFSSVCVDTGNGAFGFFVNQIKSLEMIS